MKKPILSILIGGILAAVGMYITLSFIPVISTTEKYNISVDPIMVADHMGTETHVALKNTGKNTLTNVTVHYSGTTRSDIIPILNPGEKVSLSPPDASDLSNVMVTTDQGINVTKQYRTPASADFVGNSGYGG
ncbi:MAG TPA: hypothetical protein VK431_06975 [Nitrosopumilaceae archaeon]|nr:hypothetical protein [Nitrosopumilaceae archaeon]